MAKRSPRSRPLIDSTVGPLGERAYPEVADALRSRIKPILRAWEKAVRQFVEPARGVSFDEILDGLPDILAKISDALASDNTAEVAPLMERSPEQGIHRFQIHYDVRQLATEDRILRRLVNEQVGAALGRRATAAETSP